MLIAFCPVYLSSSKFELYMLSRVYCGYKLTAVKDTPYGQLAALMRAGETFFFSDGKPLETINAPNAEIVENNVILPMLFCDNPQTALLIGGAGRYAPAILSQGVKTLDYVEINPQLIDFVSKNKFVSPKIKIHYTDGVKFINNEPASLYDAVFVDVAYPLALSLNRYYTKEFFASLDKRLTKDGIVVISMPGSMAYIDRRLGGMNSVIFETLKSSFKYVKIIPGETYVYIATDSPISATEIVKRRFKKMGVHTDYLSDKYIDYKLDPVKENWVKAELEKNKSSIFGKITLNKEFYPAALFRSLLYWQSIFSPRTAGILQSVSNLIWLPIICIVMLILLSKQGYAAVSFSTGAAAMGLQMSAIWAIGALNGSVYYWIGLLNAFFMAGTGVGAFYAIQDSKLIIKNRIYQIEITLIAWIIVWYALISAIAVPWPIIFLLSLGSGALLGLQFPMLAESGSAPKIYAADVLGGCMAAIVGGAIIIPAWGLSGMFVMLFLLKAASVFGVWQDF
jgi:spermidine synthase